MKKPPAYPWIHLGECPVCVNGLCRVRTCTGCSDGKPRHYAVCDECEACWTVPDTTQKKTFADAQDPACPICGVEMYGPQSHWSLPEELRGTDWAANAILDVGQSVGPAGSDLLTTDDMVGTLDAPPESTWPAANAPENTPTSNTKPNGPTPNDTAPDSTAPNNTANSTNFQLESQEIGEDIAEDSEGADEPQPGC